MVIRIKNNTDSLKTWCGQEIGSGEYYQLQDYEKSQWAHDETLIIAIANSEAVVNDGTNDFTNVDQGIDYLKGNLPTEVTPTSPKNEFMLNVAGMGKFVLDQSDSVATITLSNKNGLTYTYSCSIEPSEEDAVCTSGFVERMYIDEVDAENNTLTLREELDEGEYTLSKHLHIDYLLPLTPEGFTYWFLWGSFFDASNYGDNDWVMLEVVVPAIEYELRRYDECWVRHLAKVYSVNTPDGSPGQIPPVVNADGYEFSVALRIDYYPTDVTKTNTNIWYDYKLSTRDGF